MLLICLGDTLIYKQQSVVWQRLTGRQGVSLKQQYTGNQIYWS